jgi:hypothetical protein
MVHECDRLPEQLYIPVYEIEADNIESDMTEHLTDNAKKAIVGEISA